MNVVSFIEPHLEHLSMLSFTVEQTRCFKVNPQEDKCKNTREKKMRFLIVVLKHATVAPPCGENVSYV